jgi:hypothetical protein
VEWDSDLGAQEIQTITSSVYLGPNEVQTVQTHAGDVDEVQTVTTGTTEIREVQSITVQPKAGLTSMDSTWSFALSLDTVDSLQYSGQIAGDAAGSSADAAYVAGGNSARLTVDKIIGFMSNVDAGVEVSDRIDNGSGSYSWLVTFPASMGNVPQMTYYMSDVPITIATVKEGNVLGGSYRLEFGGETTGDIAHNALPAEVKSQLESLSTVGTVEVTREDSVAYQEAYKWYITFTSNVNNGNINQIVTHHAGLTGSNTLQTPTHSATPDTIHDGNTISGTFSLTYDDSGTPLDIDNIPFDATPAAFSAALTAADATRFPAGTVNVDRTSGADYENGFTWTISFLADHPNTHAGDVPLFSMKAAPTVTHTTHPVTNEDTKSEVTVTETRTGTKKEVKTITVTPLTNPVAADSTFQLTYNGLQTGAIAMYPAPAGCTGSDCCSGANREKQTITTSTADTTAVGGDYTVSTLTTFALSYGGETTVDIYAHDQGSGGCAAQATAIENALEGLSVFHDVTVTDTGAGDANRHSCVWEIEFATVSGNMPLLGIKASHGQDTDTGEN